MKLKAKTKLLFDYGEPYIIAAYEINDNDGIIVGAVEHDITVFPYSLDDLETSFKSAVDTIQRISHAKTIEEVVPYEAEG